MHLVYIKLLVSFLSSHLILSSRTCNQDTTYELLFTYDHDRVGFDFNTKIGKFRTYFVTSPTDHIHFSIKTTTWLAVLCKIDCNTNLIVSSPGYKASYLLY